MASRSAPCPLVSRTVQTAACRWPWTSNAGIAVRSCSFLGIDNDGQTCIVNTAGNPWGFLILRGGRSGPNFDAVSLHEAVELLTKAKLPPRLMVDCSHSNSNKITRLQNVAWSDCIAQRLAGNRNLVGMMLESNLNPGTNRFPPICQNCVTESRLRTAVSAGKKRNA